MNASCAPGCPHSGRQPPLPSGFVETRSIYVLRNGRVSFTGSAADLHDDAKLREVYL